MVFRSIPIWLIVFLVTVLPAESVWVNYGWQAFRNVSDAGMLSLGGVQPVLNSNIAQLGNPALTIQQERHLLTYSHQSRLAGLIVGDLVAATITTFGDRPFGLILLNESVNRIPDTRELLLDWGSDGIPGTGDTGEGNGVLDDGERLDGDNLRYFKQRQTGIHIASGWELENINVGIGIKILNHAISDYQGYGVGFDVGFASDLWDGATANLTLTDATTSWLVWDSGTVERTQPSLQTGISQNLVLKSIPVQLRILASTNLEEYTVSDGSDLNFGNTSLAFGGGIQLTYNDRTSLRFGRNYLGQTAAGIGFSWPHINLDYSFQPKNSANDLGASHYITFSLRSSWLGKILKGLELTG